MLLHVPCQSLSQPFSFFFSFFKLLCLLFLLGVRCQPRDARSNAEHWRGRALVVKRWNGENSKMRRIRDGERNSFVLVAPGDFYVISQTKKNKRKKKRKISLNSDVRRFYRYYLLRIFCKRFKKEIERLAVWTSACWGTASFNFYSHSYLSFGDARRCFVFMKDFHPHFIRAFFLHTFPIRSAYFLTARAVISSRLLPTFFCLT